MEAFYWTAKLGSFSAASAHLHTTQSAVSKRVIELEGALAVMLFDRSQKRPVLTVQGRALVETAAEMLDVVERMGTQIDKGDPFVGRFHIGVTELCALTWLPQFVANVRAQFPRLVLDPDVDASGNLTDRLEDGSLDLIVVPGSGNWHKRYRATFLSNLKIVWMASPLIGMPRGIQKVAALAAYPLLMQSPTSAVSKLHEDWLREHGVSTKEALRTNSLPVIGQLTAAGLGISALPLDYFKQDISRGTLQVVKTEPAPPSVDYYVLHRADGATAVAEEIARMVKVSCHFRRTN
ncbi:LysR family transcriptional regulator [Paraburkholderia sediminicola]|uniref:LysR family transcriptional regulator n=1 Tax=Paraburkholderia sediminicola TaxID=458836 RepID=UPI0038B94814